eukprot:scaffold3.g6762.t1
MALPSFVGVEDGGLVIGEAQRFQVAGAKWCEVVERVRFHFPTAFATCFPLVRLALNALVLKPLARRLVRAPGGGRGKADALRVREERFAESGWKLLVYTAFTAHGGHLLLAEGWAARSADWWRGWPAQPTSAALRRQYAAQLGFYLASVWMLAAWETRRKDHAIMMTHHIATIALIGLSSALRFMRVGAVIMALHDVNDVFLEAAKLCRYAEAEGGATALLATFVLSWAATRLGYFPLVVIRSVLFEGPEVMGAPPPLHRLFAGLLLLLLAMHVYWFGLILRIAARKATSGMVQDVREDGGGEEDDG